MKKFSASLMEHLQQSVTTIALCWKIKLSDGRLMGFTEHDQDIYLNDMHYLANTDLGSSAIENSTGLKADNLQIEAVLSHHLIKREDIMAGRYDNAEVEIIAINFAKPMDGDIVLFRGGIASIKLSGDHFMAELKSNSDLLNNTIGELYSPLCRANFCDARCKLNKDNFSYHGTIEQVMDTTSFLSSARNEAAGFFNYGLITMLSGANIGLSFSIKESEGGVIMLNLPPPHPLCVHDEYSITAGCDKRFSTCSKRFNNAINFRGEPNIPGYDGLV